jgi:hypothetical protein
MHMRHLLGVIFGVVLAAALVAGGGWGYNRLARAMTLASPHLTSTRSLLALAALLGTGLLLGLLLAGPWVSPLATVLPGLAALGWTALYVVSQHRAIQLVPLKSSHAGQGAEVLLETGVYALLGIAMLIPLFVPSRWRRRRPVEDEMEEDDNSPTAATSSFLS